MRKSSAWLAAFFVIAVVAGGCSRPDTPQGGGEQARRMVEQGALLLDVRTPMEFQRSHLPGAVNLPLQLLDQNLGQLNKTQPIVVYCQSGSRSRLAAETLRNSGFEVFDLGGMFNW